MRRPDWLQPPRGVRWTPALGTSLAAVSVLAVIGGGAVLSLLGSLLTFGGSADPAEALKPSLDRAKTLSELDRKRFDGRSAFFMPPAPVREVAKPSRPPPPPKPPEPPKPPPPPAEYAGPKPVGAMGNSVYFADNSRLKVGEERGGVKVLGSSPPWTVRLAHAGGEYDVPLWSRGNEPFFNGDWSSIKPVPGIETVGSTPPTPAAGRGSVPGAPASAGSPGRAGGGMPPPVTPPLPRGVPQPDQPPPAELPAGTPPPTPGTAGAPVAIDAASPPLTAEQVASMTKAEVQAALQAITRSRQSRNIDDSTLRRLNSEFGMLSGRMKELVGQSAPE